MNPEEQAYIDAILAKHDSDLTPHDLAVLNARRDMIGRNNRKRIDALLSGGREVEAEAPQPQGKEVAVDPYLPTQDDGVDE